MFLIIFCSLTLLLPIVSIHAIVSIHYPARLLSYWTPADVIISPINQHIFIVDQSYNRVLHLSPDALYLSTLHVPIDQSKLNSPIKLAVDVAGYLYVTTGNTETLAMIYKYNIIDNQLTKNISLPFASPAALTISPIDGNIFIAFVDVNETFIYVLDSNGKQINRFNGSNFSPPLGEPTALAMDKTAERLYVADRKELPTGKVFLLDSHTGEQLQYYINTNIYRPTGVVVDDDLNVYIADKATNCIVALMPNSTLIRLYTNSLYSPQGLTFSANGNLLLSDTLNNRMILFDIRTAAVLKVYTSQDPAMIAPRLVTALESGDIYINSLNDAGAYNILKKLTITNSSAYISQIIDPKPHFSFPVSLASNDESQIYVTDAYLPYGCIDIFASNGTKIGEVCTNNPNMKNPNGISIDSQSHFYVADSGNSRVIKLSKNGTIIQNYRTTPSLIYPYDVKVRADGVVYISDSQCSCIYQLTNDGQQLAIIHLEDKPYLIRPFITLSLSTAWSLDPDVFVTVTYPSPQINRYASNGTLTGIYTIPISASTGWDPYASAINQKYNWLIVAETSGRLMFFDL